MDILWRAASEVKPGEVQIIYLKQFSLPSKSRQARPVRFVFE